MRITIICCAFPAALFIALLGCKDTPDQTRSYLDVSGIDTLIDPGDDFFEYANGIWMDTVPIPSTEVGVGSFYDLQVKSAKALKVVCEEAAALKNPRKGSLEQMVGDLYASIMDTVTIEKRGLEPLARTFDEIDNISGTKEMLRFIARETVNGNSTVFDFAVGPDDKNASINIAGFSQSGLGLPNRDYYFTKDSVTASVRSAYLKYLTTIFALLGEDSLLASRHAHTVMAVETQMAKGHFTNVELRKPEKNYNKLGLSELNDLMPNMDWKTLCANLYIRTDTVLVAQLPFFITLDELMENIPLYDWKKYLKATTIGNSAQSLTKALADASFDFYGKALIGQKERKPRWQYAVNTVDVRIGDLVGQLYVKENFDASAKHKMMELIDNLQKSYEKRIRNLDWMSKATRKEAQGKLNTMIKKIGFPDTWKSYDSLVISREDYFKNRINTSRYEFLRDIAKNGKPVDRNEWAFTPPTVNAFYNATTNEIMFLAGMLQPPFFYPYGDDAINYGAIGMVIGHEFTHGFDDEGRLYDKYGNLKDWWLKEDAEKFEEKTKLVGKQYAAYIAMDSIHLNPDLTMGENLADIGGLAIAYDAFKMTSQGKQDKKIDGLTPDQRFFIAFAKIWQMKIKEELMRQLMLNDPHSPARFRVNGPLSNFTPFYKAFGITNKNAMWKPLAERIQVW